MKKEIIDRADRKVAPFLVRAKNVFNSNMRII